MSFLWSIINSSYIKKTQKVLVTFFLVLISFLTITTQAASTNTSVLLFITQNLTLIVPTLSVNPGRISVGGDINFTTTSLKYSDNSIASNIVCRLIITAPDGSKVRLQGKTDANGLCNYRASLSLGSQGLSLIEGSLNSINTYIGFSSAIVEYVFGATTPTTNTVFYEVFVDQIILNLYKDRPNDDIYTGQKMSMQAEIRNPNDFNLQTVETTISVDPKKIKLISGSVRIGNTLKGSKYATLSDFFNIKAEAQTAGSLQSNIQFLNDYSFKIIFPSMISGQTIPLTFDIVPLTTDITNITGTSVIIASGQASFASVKLSPPADGAPIFEIIRTGGVSFGPLILLIILLSFGTIFVLKDKEDEVEVKIS